MIRFALVMLLLFPALVRAELLGDKCTHKADHTSLSLLLVDLSDKIADIDNFKRSIAVFSEMVRPGERVVVGISTDKVGDVKLLMDFVNPEESVWESKLKIRALQKTFKDCLKENITHIEEFNQKFDKSAILETIGFTSKIFKADTAPSKRLVIYSDMMQNSPAISFYNQKVFENKLLIATTKKAELIPDLDKVEVYIAGVGSHETDKKAGELEKYWNAFFEAAKAHVNYFGPVLISL